MLFLQFILRQFHLGAIMRTLLASLNLARSLSISTVGRKEDLISNLFLKQIRELASKQKAAGSLVNTSPELKKQLDEQLNRLAQKFKLVNAEIVTKLAVELEKPSLQSSVAAISENRTLDDVFIDVCFVIFKNSQQSLNFK